jgi:uncharacterized protein
MIAAIRRLAVWLAPIMACTGVHATRVDCESESLSRIEKTICSRDDLAALDNAMADTYRRMLSLARTPADVTAAQRRWLAARNRCKDAACVARAYRDRMAELRATPVAGWRDFHDPATGLRFRYLANRSVKPCAGDAGPRCSMLSGPGMAAGSAYFLQLQVVDGSLETVAGSLWEKQGDGWIASGRGDARSPVEPFAGDGWRGLVADTVCGVGDAHGFHAAGGDCLTYLMSNGRRTVVMTTDGASGHDPETLATIRSAQFFFIVALHGVSSATPLDAGVQGVWSGTIGSSAVVACFDARSDDGQRHGSYYYVRYLAPIALTPRTVEGEWAEGADARWTLSSPEQDRLEGAWRSSDGRKELPVRLTRLPGTSATQACGSDTYNLPLEHEALKMKVGQVRYLGQRRYRPVSIAGVQLVELIDAAPGIAAINRQLRAELPGDDEARRRQLRELVRTQGRYSFDTVTSEPVEWTDRSVTIRLHRDFAGAGASGSEDGSRTWNAVSGREIDPWRWFGVASDRSADLPLPVVSRTGLLPAKLKDYLVQAAHAGGDCSALYDESSAADIHVSEAGVEFLLGDTLLPECMRTVLVSPEAVQPFLNGRGKAELRWLTKK